MVSIIYHENILLQMDENQQAIKKVLMKNLGYCKDENRSAVCLQKRNHL